MTDQLLARIREVQDTEASAEEQEAWFEERTAKHIALVQAAAKKIEQAHILNGEDCGNLMAQVALHDQSKLVEPERTPYISITWRHKQEAAQNGYDPIHNKGYKTPGTLSKEEENQATLQHITNNSHHPEYHLKDKSQANINAKDRDKSDRVVDASAMPDIDIAEMVADWQAMSEELQKNTAREWYDKQKEVRWHFSKEQDELIDKLLKVFETELVANEAWKDHPDPSGFMRAAHDPKNTRLVWWYNPQTALFVKSMDAHATHSDDLNAGNIEPGEVKTCARGRVFEFEGKAYLIIYWPDKKRMTTAQLIDLFDKVQNSVDVTITRVIDDNGENIEGLFESTGCVFEKGHWTAKL